MEKNEAIEQRIRAYKLRIEDVRLAKQALADEQIETGYTIRQQREKKGLKLKELAENLNLSSPFLYDVELGRRSTSIKNLEEISRICS